MGSSALRPAVISFVLGLSLISVSAGISARFAQQLLTPVRNKPDDVEVLHIAGESVTFSRNAVSAAPGRYGMFWDDERGHAQIGDVLHTDETSVTRALLTINRGELRPGPARMSSYFFAGDPTQDFGVEMETITLQTPVGGAPAWVIPAGNGQRWAVLIHGRGASRHEVLRAVPILVELGISCIIPSYRNDPDAPSSADARYGLGLTEWRDVECALDYARAHGATTIDLLGWSMGGAIAMQLLQHSCHRQKISRIFLDGPVLDWRQVMRHHAREHHLPRVIDLGARWLMKHPHLSKLFGLDEPLVVSSSVVATWAHELKIPVWIIHCVDDDFVPYLASEHLSQRRPDLVTWSRWDKAGHVREWNTEPRRWENELRLFMTKKLLVDEPLSRIRS